MAIRKKAGDNSSDDEIRNYLAAYGVRSLSEETVVTPESMAESGYKEVPYSHMGQIGMMFQQLPGLATHAISYQGTYRVYFDKSLGVLQQAKQGDGFLRANVVQAGTNNKITGQALLKAASAGPLVANAVFSALSMVTGQYFLSEINGKLSQIEKKIDSIPKFLENEKRSELLANYYYLQQVIQTFEYIQSNEFQKSATIQQLQRIRIDSFGNLNFYSTAFQQKKAELTGLKSNTKKNIKKIPGVINEIGDIVLLYKFALYTYSLAYYLEIMLSGNMDSNYINFVKKDIKSKTNDYKNLVKYFSDEMSAFFVETKVYDTSAFLDICANIVGAGASRLLLGNPTLGIMITDAINSKSEDKKKSARNEVVKQVNVLLKQCREYAPFTRLENDLTNYDRIMNNSKLELVCTDDKAYIKFSDIDTEKEEDKPSEEN